MIRLYVLRSLIDRRPSSKPLANDEWRGWAGIVVESSFGKGDMSFWLHVSKCEGVLGYSIQLCTYRKCVAIAANVSHRGTADCTISVMIRAVGAYVFLEAMSIYPGRGPATSKPSSPCIGSLGPSSEASGPVSVACLSSSLTACLASQPSLEGHQYLNLGTHKMRSAYSIDIPAPTLQSSILIPHYSPFAVLLLLL